MSFLDKLKSKHTIKIDSLQPKFTNTMANDAKTTAMRRKEFLKH